MGKLIAREFRAALGFVIRDLHLTRRYLGWEIVFIGYSLVNALALGLIKVDVPAEEQAEGILFLVTGAVFWSFLIILFGIIADTIAWERWEGTIEYTFMAPIHRVTHLLGESGFGVCYSIVRSIFVLVVVVLFFHFSYPQAHILGYLKDANFLGAVLVLAVASLSFLGMGIMAAVLPLLSPEKGPQATHVFQALIMLVSGVYYNVSVLPAWIRPVSRLSPGTYALRSIRGALLEGQATSELLGDILILLIAGAALIPLGVWVFHLAEMTAKRKGFLKRSG